MENSVLGNALEGVPEEEEEEDDEGKTPKDSSVVEGTENVDGMRRASFTTRPATEPTAVLSPTETTRDELRDQVYDAMAEKKEEEKQNEEEETGGGEDQRDKENKSEGDKGEPEGEEKTQGEEAGKESGEEEEAAEGDEG